MSALPQPNTLNGITGNAVSFNVTTFNSLIAPASFSTTETDRQMIYQTAGTLSKLTVFISANTIATSPTTVTSRNNGAAGSQSVSIPVSGLGEFQDGSNSDSIAAGDKLAVRFVTPNSSGSITVLMINSLFSATTDSLIKVGNRNASSGTNPATFPPLTGVDLFSADETRTQEKIRGSFTFKNLYTNMISNSSDQPVTFRLRKNTANGNMNFSVGAGSFGILGDATNTDSVVSGDLVNYSVNGAGTTGTFIFGCETSVEIASTNNQGLLLEDGSVTLNASTTDYLSVGGTAGFSTTESAVAQKFLSTAIVSNMLFYVSANTVVDATTVTSRKNSGAGNQTFSIPGVTFNAFFEDATNTDTLSATDTINTQIAVGAAGTSLLIRHSAFLVTFSNIVVTTVFPNPTLLMMGVGL